MGRYLPCRPSSSTLWLRPKRQNLQPSSTIAAREAIPLPLRVTLLEMGHPQPKTPVTTDNTTAHGLIKGTMIPKASKPMDMRFQWTKCRRAQRQFDFLWRRGPKNRADYPSKHHPPSHHLKVRGDYVVDLPPKQ